MTAKIIRILARHNKCACDIKSDIGGSNIWKIKIKSDLYYSEHDFDLKDKKVLISFESKSLGDNLAWIPYVEKFMTERNCKVLCSTFFNGLFRNQYPKIEFVEPGSVISDIYALYRIGLFFTNGPKSFTSIDEFDKERHPLNPIQQPLGKIASDILGLEYEEEVRKIIFTPLVIKAIDTLGNCTVPLAPDSQVYLVIEDRKVITILHGKEDRH